MVSRRRRRHLATSINCTLIFLVLSSFFPHVLGRTSSSCSNGVDHCGDHHRKLLRVRQDKFNKEANDAWDNTRSVVKWIFPSRKLGFEHSQCGGAWDHKGFPDACSYARAKDDCSSQGLVDYLRIFFCFAKDGGAARKAVAVIGMTLWLAALFYMLGSTAADYFCVCLEQLAVLLKLSPTLAGVTLLPLGNGAPDVFASLVAFLGGGSGGSIQGGTLGLTAVLGGALFVVTVVAGLVNILAAVGGHSVRLERGSFLRDGIFFLTSLTALTAILWCGGGGVLGAVAYLSLYGVYALAVAASETFGRRQQPEIEESLLLPAKEGEKDIPAAAPTLFRRASRLLLKMPLTLPRQLTIPVVDESRWSRYRAVTAVTLSPVLVAALWVADGRRSPPLTWMAAGATAGAAAIGAMAAATTTRDNPPRGFTLLAMWLTAGFAMSIVWFYIIARELVATLTALSAVLGVDPAILGVTVLAWGNSVGDLVANCAMARGGFSGIQIAMAGCYAGPMFNILFGLGISFIATAVRSRAGRFEVDGSGSTMQSVVFLVAAIFAAMVALPLRGMQPSRGLGAVLLIIYAAFLVTQSISHL